jgi:hypothetical protein
MNSVRRETTAGVLSSALSALNMKHTVDDRNVSKPNRHLVAITGTEYDTAGKSQTGTTHTVVTRAKGVSDACMKKQMTMLGAWLAVSANQDALLRGEN